MSLRRLLKWSNVVGKEVLMEYFRRDLPLSAESRIIAVNFAAAEESIRNGKGYCFGL